MNYLKGRIQTKNTTLMHILFSAFYRSMIIYFMTRLHGAGAITEEENTKFETLLIREQLGLVGDIKSDVINKVMFFYIDPTASIVTGLGSKLRMQIEASKRAKAKKSVSRSENHQQMRKSLLNIKESSTS
jgi:hypothetical protein